MSSISRRSLLGYSGTTAASAVLGGAAAQPAQADEPQPCRPRRSPLCRLPRGDPLRRHGSHEHRRRIQHGHADQSRLPDPPGPGRHGTGRQPTDAVTAAGWEPAAGRVTAVGHVPAHGTRSAEVSPPWSPTRSPAA
ncbi:twin-arginine translocation signal domain-containing protein [Streptomyces sp. NBC_01669]|uniref:twin-arginine translocation signal domain-containing protein n=1 Tax=Streptomyces sp. NBC_01669 TaxID=2975909 RepID=UPI0033900F1F